MSYSLGAVAVGTRKPGAIVSQSTERLADAFDRTVVQIRELPILKGVTYDPAKFQRARARTESVIGRVASIVGVAVLSKEDVQQLLLGALGRIQAAARNLRVVARVDSARARSYETRLVAAVQQLLMQTGQIAAMAPVPDAVSGLGFIVALTTIAIALTVLTRFVLSLDNTDSVLRELDSVCPPGECDPEQRAKVLQEIRATRAAADEGDMFGFREIGGGIGTVIKVVGIGAAVAVGAYLLWTLSPVLIGAGRKARAAGKRKFAT